MDGCDRVFHAAGRVSFRPGDEAQLKAVNAVGTANVVNAALTTGIRRLVHISSVAALGRSSVDRRRGALPVSERSDWAEGAGSLTLWRQQARRGDGGVAGCGRRGSPAFAVNPTVILGDARYGESSGLIYRRAAKGGRFYPIGGNGYVGVADVVAAVAALDEAVDQGREDILGERFVVSAEDVLHRDVMAWAAEGLGAGGADPPPHWMDAGPCLACRMAGRGGHGPSAGLDPGPCPQHAVVHVMTHRSCGAALPDFRFQPDSGGHPNRPRCGASPINSTDCSSPSSRGGPAHRRAWAAGFPAGCTTNRRWP